MKTEYFEWERQATIHPLLLCMKSWAEPTKKYCGRAWPTSYVKYAKDIVFWVNKHEELLEYGEYLIDIYLKEKNRVELENDIFFIAKKFDKQFKHLDSFDLKSCTDKRLHSEYEALVSLFISWFVPGAFVEPIGLAGEIRIRALLTKKGVGEKDLDAYLSVITTTPRKTFSKQELESLVLCERGFRTFEEHAAKWYWIHNNYYSTEILDASFFKKDVGSLSQKHGNLEEYVHKITAEFKGILFQKNEYLDSLSLTKEELDLVELLELFAWYQDYRKEYTMRFLHYLDVILQEVGKRANLSLSQIKRSLRKEIPLILEGTFDTHLLDLRQNAFLAVWDAQEEVFTTYTKDAEEVWKRIDPHIKHNEQLLEISGQPASRGITRGHARVTMNAKDAHDLKQGEILITSMTTPDFVTAMKKAGAVVTNEGGILCHAAVISREFGIPCVVGTKIATKTFRTGDLIEVDGDKGIVRKL